MSAQLVAHFPLATYRLQFNSEFTFLKATELVCYLNVHGMCDYYASPILAARSGSTHGYYVIDTKKLNPELDSDLVLQSLLAMLKAHGMGMILNLVPNHMCILGGNNE